MRTHPITGLRLEDGHGRLPDDLQARRIHIPYIRATQGDKVAERMLLELDHKERNTSDAWNEWRKEEMAKIGGTSIFRVVENRVVKKTK